MAASNNCVSKRRPIPNLQSPDDVIVRLKAAAVNHTDMQIRQGSDASDSACRGFSAATAPVWSLPLAVASTTSRTVMPCASTRKTAAAHAAHAAATDNPCASSRTGSAKQSTAPMPSISGCGAQNCFRAAGGTFLRGRRDHRRRLRLRLAHVDHQRRAQAR